MDFTPAQRRTVRDLIGLGRAPPVDPVVGERLRSTLEERLNDSGFDAAGVGHIWLGKRLLAANERCEGLFQSVLQREGPGFEHSHRTVAGSLLHRAIELDVATERQLDPRSLCERAAANLDRSDTSFGAYWSELDALDRGQILVEAGGQLELFRVSFPPLTRRWAPQPELRITARIAGGKLVLSGTPDLVLGRVNRLVLDFKTGGAWPEHAEDMRFYALLLTLRTGVVPYRVATFFLDSGEWQAEDVTEDTLRHASDRVVRAAVAAVTLGAARDPLLRPGPHCEWCPRQANCPAAAAWFESRGSGKSSDAA